MASVWSWVREKIPAGVEVFDAHAHIGVDVDGRIVTADEMRALMDAADVRRSIVFPLNDPNARDDYSGPNDVIWNAYEEYPISFVPFFRLNPHLDYDREFARCVDRGFMGLKLHPVSQQFELDDPKEVDLPVLIHAGFAMQRIVEPLLPTVEAHPELRLILGHAAMVEVLEATRTFADHPNVLFETSVVQAKDLYELCRSIDPSRICFGSDIPYGDLPSTLHSILSASDTAGVPDEGIRGILSGNIRRWFP